MKFETEDMFEFQQLQLATGITVSLFHGMFGGGACRRETTLQTRWTTSPPLTNPKVGPGTRKLGTQEGANKP